MERCAISETDAATLWMKVEPQLAVVIRGTIRKMGLPKGGVNTPTTLFRAPGQQAVRASLRRDERLHDDIQQDVFEQYWNGVRRGTVPAEATAGYVLTITVRSTWRLATAQARVLFATATSSASQNFNDIESIPTDENDIEDLLDSRDAWRRLAPHLRRLDADDRRLLLAKLNEESYAALAEELGATEGSLRIRLHRIREKLRKLMEQPSADPAAAKPRSGRKARNAQPQVHEEAEDG